jgi:hypothetical protein
VFVVCLAQIEGLLGKKLDSIYEGNASALRVLSVVGPEGFLLRNRALHVYSEAGRVYAFRDVCKVSTEMTAAASRAGSRRRSAEQHS